MPLTGEAKRVYQREYMRRKRAGGLSGQDAWPQEALTPRPREQRVIQALVTGEAKTLSAAMVKAGFNPTSKTVRDRFKPGGDLREVLDRELTKAGLTLPRILRKLAAKLDATKHMTVAGEAIVADDNDAQLRATDQALRLHERTGTIPSLKEAEEDATGGPVASINIIIGSKAEAKPEGASATSGIDFRVDPKE